MPKLSCDCLSKFLAMPKAAALIFAASLGSLIFAFIMQYGFNVQPCVLCLWQRVPFGLAAVLALMAIIWRPYGGHTRALLGVGAALFLANAGLAFFHTGVEQHWWLGTSGCAITPLHGDSIATMREKLLTMAAARCDEISWTFLGLSMANWNLPFSLALAIFSFLAARRAHR